MSKTFFTSDTHFGHNNIRKYSKRPFLTVEEMDRCLIENWNSVVGQRDTVWHLGDFGLWKDGRGHQHAINVLKRLNGDVHFILGNHDKPVRKHDVFEMFRNGSFLQVNKNFFNIQDISVRDEEMGLKQRIVLCHFPIESWNHRHHGAWHLHGHCHGTLPSSDHQARMDVGVDAVGQYTSIDSRIQPYTPIEYEQVKAIMTRKVFKPIDHHGG